MTTSFIKMTQTDWIAILTLNRPDKRNAMHGLLVTELSQVLKTLAQKDTRVLLIQGAGDHFCAGGDIAWMQQMVNVNDDQNYDDAQALADLLYQLYHFPVPTIVLAHGATLGGGLGLAAAADIVLAEKDAIFGFPEVKIGLTPSIISPYVLKSMGERLMHYYFLTGERFNAKEALAMGLIHKIIHDKPLLDAGLALANQLLENSPKAMHEVKKLIRYVTKQNLSEDLSIKTAEHLAELRVTEEAQEGLQAFIEKRRANWSPD